MYDVSVSTSENGHKIRCKSWRHDGGLCPANRTRREKLGGAAECARPVAVAHAPLAEAEVGDLDVALGVEQEIVELQIPVDRKMR